MSENKKNIPSIDAMSRANAKLNRSLGWGPGHL